MMDNFLKDIRYAARVLTKNAGMTAIMVFTLALAIGATTAIFSVVYGVLLRPLPYPNPDRIVALFEVNYKGGNMNLADPNFNDLRTLNRSLQAAAEYRMDVTSISGGAEPARAGIGEVSADFFKAIGVQPAIGRGFVAEDQRRGAAPVALVSYDYWRQNLSGSTNFSQFKLKIEDRVYSVVGVMPAGFHYPPDTDVWFPRELDEINTSRTAHNWRGIGRLRDGVTLAQARADVAAVGVRVVQQYCEGGNFSMRGFNLMPLQDSMTGRSRPALLILLGAVGFLLLVACANIANLLLSQASARERELAIRTALGANRGRLVRQFFTEVMLLCLLAGGLGRVGRVVGSEHLLALAPKDLPRLDSISINCRYCCSPWGFRLRSRWDWDFSPRCERLRVSPAARWRRVGAIKRAHRAASGSDSAIVMAQVAITLVLLVGAGLLGRSLLRVLSVNPGFRTERVLTMDWPCPSVWGSRRRPGRQNTPIEFQNELFARLRAIPGVEEVGAANAMPLDGGLSDGMFVELNPRTIPKKHGRFRETLSRTHRALARQITVRRVTAISRRWAFR